MTAATSVFTSLWIVDGGRTGPAVIPVLIGPLQTLIPVLWGLLLVLLRFVIRLFTPVGLKEVGRFFWHQKVFSGAMIVVIAGLWYCGANNWWRPAGPVGLRVSGMEWAAFRGGPTRTGSVDDGKGEPTVGDAIWAATPKLGGFKATEFKTFYSSPSVVGNRLFVAAADYQLMSDQGAIYCLDTDTGQVVWEYSAGFRSTFSSPAIIYKKDKDGRPNTDDGYVVCGEGLHKTADARVFCLNLRGEKLWEYRTNNHVEASPCIADGRVYIGAGEDGYYCFDLEPKDGQAHVVWHIGGLNGPVEKNLGECDTSPLVVDGVCYLGLGRPKKDGRGGYLKNTGKAILAVDARTGELLWRMDTPFTVFSAPTAGYRLRAGADGKPVREMLLFVGMGNGDFVATADELKQEAIARLTADKATPEQIAEATKTMGPAGQVWCINLSKGASAGRKASSPPPIEWVFSGCKDTVLGGTAFVAPDPATPARDGAIDGRLYFGSRDGFFYCVSTADGKPACGPFNAGSPIITCPAVGREYVYFATNKSGTLHGLSVEDLKPVWQSSLGGEVISSPALANGHVYIGTNESGLRCIGRVAPVAPTWTAGWLGGAADRTPLGPQAKLGGRFPADSAEEFKITAPMMPLPEIVKSADSQPAAATAARAAKADQVFHYLYAAVTENGRNELVKFRHGGFRRGGDPVVWRTKFDRPIGVPLAGIGDEIYVVEGESPVCPGPVIAAAESIDVPPLLLHGVRVTDGKKLWNVPLPAAWGSGLFAIDGARFFVWAGTNTLVCVERQGGGAKVIWSARIGLVGIGPPDALGGLIIVATDAGLSAIDGDSGAILWTCASPAKPTGGPVRCGGGSVLLPTQAGLCRCSLAGGAVEWKANIGPVVSPPVADSEKVVAVNAAGKMFVLDIATGLPLRLADEYELHYDRAAAATQPAETEKVDRLIAVKGAYQSKATRLRVIQADGEFLVEDRRFVRLVLLDPAQDWWIALAANQPGVTVTKTADEYELVYGGDTQKKDCVRWIDGEWYCQIDSKKASALRDDARRDAQPDPVKVVAGLEYQRDAAGRLVQVIEEKDGRRWLEDGRWERRPANMRVALFPAGGDWFCKDSAHAIASMAGKDAAWTLTLKDGRKVRAVLADNVWYNNAAPAHKMVAVPRRLAPVVNVDGRVVPVVMGDSVLCVSAPEGGGPGDLVLVTLPERYQQKAAFDAAAVEEQSPAEQKRWCATSFMGRILAPVVIIEGQAYLATEKLGLVNLK